MTAVPAFLAVICPLEVTAATEWSLELQVTVLSAASPGETAMLGDKLLTDVLGARRSSVWALMVEPLGGPVGGWNRFLHLLQRPFKEISKRRQNNHEQI